MKNQLKSILRYIFFPIANAIPLQNWNYWGGRLYNIKLTAKVKSFDKPENGSSANINIIMHLLTKSDHLEGHIAECGVFQGATLIPITYMMNRFNDQRKIYGFDSFEGFGKEAEEESRKDNTGHIDLETTMFKNTSIALIQKKLKLTKTNTDNLILTKGFFEDSLPSASDKQFSFVHLDCDLASSYQTCLEFFYSRMNVGGYILFDEYFDPVYTSATETIDVFFKDKAEKPMRIERDNYIKYYIQKR
jgi:hypothetical protein